MIHPIVIASMAHGGPTVTLSGTSLSPNEANHLTGFGTARAGWRFNADGTVDKNEQGVYTQFQAGVEVVIPGSATSDLYIRATVVGDAPSTGPTLNIWHAWTSDQEWEWTRNSNGLDSGRLVVSVARDSGGTNISATGHYRGEVEFDDT